MISCYHLDSSFLKATYLLWEIIATIALIPIIGMYSTAHSINFSFWLHSVWNLFRLPLLIWLLANCV